MRPRPDATHGTAVPRRASTVIRGRWQHPEPWRREEQHRQSEHEQIAIADVRNLQLFLRNLGPAGGVEERAADDWPEHPADAVQALRQVDAERGEFFGPKTVV